MDLFGESDDADDPLDEDEAGGDDLLGGDDFGDDFDDDFDGDFEDDFDDGFDDGGGGDVDELSHRVDELENELSAVSSTMSTVRSENEEIAGTVEDIEENVRNLLDIYEMVTRGVNPFVDEVSEAPGDGGTFGLFDDGPSTEDQAAEIDEEVANADAESFFEDDFDEDADDGADDGFDDVSGVEEDGGEPSFDADAADLGGSAGGTETASDGGDGDGGRSFQELKDEYESGDADWADEDIDDLAAGDDAGTGGGPEDGGADVPAGGGPTPDLGDEDDAFEEAFSDDPGTALDDAGDALAADPEEATADPDPDPGDATADRDGAAPTSPADDGAAATGDLGEVGAGTSRPYLRGLPDGYAVDLLVMEWLEYLVVEAGPAGSRAAIGYYEDIEWLDAPAADALRAFLPGITPSVDAAAADADADAPAADAGGATDDEFVWVADAADGDTDEGLETTAEVDLTEYEADVEGPGATRSGPTARAGGAGRASLAADGAPPSLTPEHHRRSLAYISRIADDQQATTLIEHWDGGEPDGV